MSSLSMTASSSSRQPRLVAIGNFDGVHRGHRSVLGAAAAEASRAGLVPTVLTFFPHPAEVLGQKRQPVLTVLERKIELIRAIDSALEVVVQPFDLELAQLSPREFVESILVKELDARQVFVGENFRFGHKRAGDLARLRELGAEFGFVARSEELVTDDVGAVSSTRIRRELAEGNVARAGEMLGRPHRLGGTVIQGDRRGRTIGFPTANLDDVRELLPADGVYAVRVSELGASEATTDETLVDRLGVMNLGPRPTVERPYAIEVHVLDFEGDLYGRRLVVDFVERIRGVNKFSSLDELKSQIARDVDSARSALGVSRSRSPVSA